MKPYMLFLLAFASFLYAKDGLENKEVLHLEEAISLNTLKSAPDEPDIGEGGAANTLQQMESVAKGEQTEESVDDSNENEDNEIIDSEPEDNLEDQETVTLSDSISFPDTLFIDMTGPICPQKTDGSPPLWNANLPHSQRNRCKSTERGYHSCRISRHCFQSTL
jgi:hypothetical protein